ncbi:hypothetical protein [Nannocystis pusilla]|uniref:hypothetical protein n=1 Tax=Nannocystis pusilla TaxID=889268 RepID=UPI003B7AD4EB
MHLVAAKDASEMDEAERRAVLGYSGWGGLSIPDNRHKMPAGLIPESFGEIHEYYTPSVLAEAIAERVCPFCPSSPAATASCAALNRASASGASFAPCRAAARAAAEVAHGGILVGLLEDLASRPPRREAFPHAV